MHFVHSSTHPHGSTWSLSTLIQNSCNAPSFITVVEVQWSRTSSLMSSSSHKRHRLTQKEVRELFDARSVSERSTASVNNQDESIAKNQTTTPSTSNNNPSSLPRFASFPTVNPQAYETPMAQKDPLAHPSRTSEESEPSTFLSLEAASSMSTIPSDASSTRFMRRPSPDTFSQAFPIVAVTAGVAPNELPNDE